MSRLRVILQAGKTDSPRWDHHLGVPKHKLVIDGEPIIDRTVRQLMDRDCEVVVIAPADSGYYFPGALRWLPPDYASEDTQVGSFLFTRPLWNLDGPTALLYGDVRWTDEAITSVTSYSGPDDWHLWYRPGCSQITGRAHGEIWAHWWTPALNAREEIAFRRVLDLYKRGVLTWKQTGGWPVYRAMLGMPDVDLNGYGTPDHDHATVIDDWTEDFDQPLDYVRWYGRWTEGRYPARIVWDGTSENIRQFWPKLNETDPPRAVVTVDGDVRVDADQVWCGIAHAVETNRMVIPYSHPIAGTVEKWEYQPMWSADVNSRRVVITPTTTDYDPEPVRLYGQCWEMDR